MKAITLWQPWASLVAIGAKPYEFRKWAAPKSVVGQRIAIHAGARKVIRAEVEDLIWRMRNEPQNCALKAEALPVLDRLLLSHGAAPLRCIVATARLGAPVRADKIMSEFGWTVGNDSDRNFHFNFAWPMLEVEEMQPPVEAKGAQGWWNWAP
jgi:hypothetical protein